MTEKDIEAYALQLLSWNLVCLYNPQDLSHMSESLPTQCGYKQCTSSSTCSPICIHGGHTKSSAAWTWLIETFLSCLWEYCFSHLHENINFSPTLNLSMCSAGLIVSSWALSWQRSLPLLCAHVQQVNQFNAKKDKSWWFECYTVENVFKPSKRDIFVVLIQTLQK